MAKSSTTRQLLTQPPPEGAHWLPPVESGTLQLLIAQRSYFLSLLRYTSITTWPSSCVSQVIWWSSSLTKSVDCNLRPCAATLRTRPESPEGPPSWPGSWLTSAHFRGRPASRALARHRWAHSIRFRQCSLRRLRPRSGSE
jgi:hypothetical protein